MPKYRVTLREEVEYEIVVEALNRDDAQDTARSLWEHSEDPTHDFRGTGYGVEEVDTVKVPDATETHNSPEEETNQ